MYFVPEGQHDRSQARSAWTGVWTFREGKTPRQPTTLWRHDAEAMVVGVSPVFRSLLGAHRDAANGAKRLLFRRDRLIVAWHEVPGSTPPQKGRPVGYGVIRAGVRADSMIGVRYFKYED